MDLGFKMNWSIVWVIMGRRGYPQDAGVLVVLVDSDYGLSPGATKPLSELVMQYRFGTSGTKFSEILSEIHTFSFKRMHLKMSSAE